MSTVGVSGTSSFHRISVLNRRCLHASSSVFANPLSITSHPGPPPTPPLPAASQYGERVDRRRHQAELIKRGQDMRTEHMKPGSAMKKRFWKGVGVKTNPGTTHQDSMLHLGIAPDILSKDTARWTLYYLSRRSARPQSSDESTTRNSVFEASSSDRHSA